MRVIKKLFDLVGASPFVFSGSVVHVPRTLRFLAVLAVPAAFLAHRSALRSKELDSARRLCASIGLRVGDFAACSWQGARPRLPHAGSRCLFHSRSFVGLCPMPAVELDFMKRHLSPHCVKDEAAARGTPTGVVLMTLAQGRPQWHEGHCKGARPGSRSFHPYVRPSIHPSVRPSIHPSMHAKRAFEALTRRELLDECLRAWAPLSVRFCSHAACGQLRSSIFFQQSTVHVGVPVFSCSLG